MPVHDTSSRVNSFALSTTTSLGVYSADLRKAYDLESADWKYDVMPEIMDGHNVLDFVDADIDARLAELEREEAEMEVGAVGAIFQKDFAVYLYSDKILSF